MGQKSNQKFPNKTNLHMELGKNYGIFGREFKKFKFLPKIPFFCLRPIFEGGHQNSAHFDPVWGDQSPQGTYDRVFS